MTMRASKLIPLLLVLAIPAAVSGVGCGSSSSNTNGGNTGGDEDTGGKPATGGKSGTGGKAGTGGSTGGSSGDTGGAGGSTGGSGGDTGGAGGSTGGASGSTGGAGGSTGGAGGDTGGSGGAGGTTAVACGMGRTKPASAVIDNFDGMKLVVEWDEADDINTNGTKINPTGTLKVTANGKNNYAVGALASWAAVNRPCMDGSMYNGIQFNVTGNVTGLFFRITTPATLPAGKDGGICTSDTLCNYAHYQKDISTSLPAGGLVKVPFMDLKPSFGTPAPFEKSSLVGIIFRTTDTNTAHTFTIDNVSFY
jgi:hypothetical protein